MYGVWVIDHEEGLNHASGCGEELIGAPAESRHSTLCPRCNCNAPVPYELQSEILNILVYIYAVDVFNFALKRVILLLIFKEV